MRDLGLEEQHFQLPTWKCNKTPVRLPTWKRGAMVSARCGRVTLNEHGGTRKNESLMTF